MQRRLIANSACNVQVKFILFVVIYLDCNVGEVKHGIYSKRQKAKMKLLPSVFSSLYSILKIFVFAVNSKRHFSTFVQPHPQGSLLS